MRSMSKCYGVVNMLNSVINNEGVWRLGFFVVIFIGMLIWEAAQPRREVPRGVFFRRANNIGVSVLDTLLVRITFPLLPVGAAMYVSEHSIGLIPSFNVPLIVAAPFVLLALDFAIYLQHRIFHAVPWLWRLHRMHHSDTEFDVTTGIRFHPIEIIASMVIKIALVFALGAPAIAVLIFEILLNATSLFNHGNVRISRRLERVLRWFVVTPEMHRVHHSVIHAETDSNFGFNLPWWDRLFGTYRSEPEYGHQNMMIGLRIFRRKEERRVDRLLSQPFRSERLDKNL